ncbi:Rv3235 family protein [Litorihabitans aurantiacus]|uniref:Uncharacterized protein n=1 Tax=Litorihabitans aurantiacus TaxID=1930061 RepID=A0AA37UUN8_9MICO|nr:Rv3235 family protein [Litorihabitans aurantiacus]GMA30651.1 hypothetical protein GCM10025875_06430 [Litorihabitans aurantiacus]
MSALPSHPDVAGEQLPAPSPVPLHPHRGPGLTPVVPIAAAPGRARANHADSVTDPTRWFGSFALAVVQVLAGGRPAQQLVRWVTTEIYGSVARRAGLHVRLHGRPTRPAHGRVLSARADTTRPGVVEVCAVVHDGRRVRAVAGRMELFRGRWRVVELQVG